MRKIVASRRLDLGLAVAFALVALAELFTGPDRPGSALAPFLILALCGSLVARRSQPLAAAGIGAATLLAAGLAGLEGDLAPNSAILVIFILSYSCGAHASFGRGLVAIAGLVVAAQLALGFADFPNVEIAFGTLAPWWAGREVGKRRRLVRVLDERTRELASEQDAFVKLSLRRERARIARELHDIVAHQVAVMVVQAGAGRLAGAENGTAAAERLRSIRESGEQALAEMSRLVDIINVDSGVRRDGASQLRAMLEHAGKAGLRVEVKPRPDTLRLPPEIEDDALRIVQEGLTNAMKHAPGADVQVRLDLTGDSLEIEVRDRGADTPSALARTGAGFGLSGMRERIESLGGSLVAGPTDEGGWRVLARLPAGHPLASAR